jgi:hypothetical protein
MKKNNENKDTHLTQKNMMEKIMSVYINFFVVFEFESFF